MILYRDDYVEYQTVVYKTKTWKDVPPSVPINGFVAAIMKQALEEVVVLTKQQRTADWFLMRAFRFTSRYVLL